ncbi:hypothetical protein EX30DRAFT_86176 [Ascodesmis nigricans]|uniref:Uncharacterized protein n=1 Tax=Ascodesmis nigricans TaxID=341454 RepID=A0A4S2N3D4_9PEZI|nr:hypothetical protein EX30DRAFT_86176 [Ascodesmis nigricans]
MMMMKMKMKRVREQEARARDERGRGRFEAVDDDEGTQASTPTINNDGRSRICEPPALNGNIPHGALRSANSIANSITNTIAYTITNTITYTITNTINTITYTITNTIATLGLHPLVPAPLCFLPITSPRFSTVYCNSGN